MKLIILVIVVIILIAIGFVPIFPKQVKNGVIKINFWDKIMTSLGIKYID